MSETGSSKSRSFCRKAVDFLDFRILIIIHLLSAQVAKRFSISSVLRPTKLRVWLKFPKEQNRWLAFLRDFQVQKLYGRKDIYWVEDVDTLEVNGHLSVKKKLGLKLNVYVLSNVSTICQCVGSSFVHRSTWEIAWFSSRRSSRSDCGDLDVERYCIRWMGKTFG